MEEGEDGSEKQKQNASATRLSLKSDSPFNNYHLWKQKFRENCYKRVRENRTRLLWKFRCNEQQQDDTLKCALEDIVSDEFHKMKRRDEVLWEYEGPPLTTCPDQYEEILLEMQRIFYEDLKSQPQELESDVEIWEHEVDEYLSRAVYEHMQLNEDEAYGKEIWCPICKEGELKDSYNLIYCTRCELQLNKASELTLDFLRDRLAEVHTEHLDRGCRLKPKFCMKTKFNLTALYISCEGCDTLEVVI
ncbi:RPA-interacting protein A isoform X1 [Vigna radiata var. radiata]|uniref:RPA-interacting protein A isoform X1 n=1 Tax=Vigna radiata var. radiata TaxID=3916 RepID=A0A1S3U2G3_VIGRR|nr:RPA-interacting protein A isoform X1 [Vigna radiata var. radiata]